MRIKTEVGCPSTVRVGSLEVDQARGRREGRREGGREGGVRRPAIN